MISAVFEVEIFLYITAGAHPDYGDFKRRVPSENLYDEPNWARRGEMPP